MYHRLTMGFLIVAIGIVGYFLIADTKSDVEIESASFTAATSTDIDMFINDWHNTESQKLFGTLDLHNLLIRCEGDPILPRLKGAVLTDINAVSYAYLDAQTSTEMSRLVDIQLIFYIVSGEGTIVTDTEDAELREGIGVLMPPGIKFTISNIGDEKLIMYVIEEPIPDGFTPKKNMVVKNEYDNPISTSLRRVSDSDNWLFSPSDGLSTIIGINPIMWEPRSVYPPHVHGPGDEEIWITVKGEMFVSLGRVRRSLPAGSVYKVPPDSRTPHVNINPGDVSQKVLWLMKVPLRRVPAGQRRRSSDGVI
ncbi:cupin domain-containing protein [Candidatus Latescibacterota bacterium]